MKLQGVSGIISFYGQDIQKIVEACDEEEMYYVLGSGSISDEDYEKLATSEETTVVDTGKDDVSITICPGYMTDPKGINNLKHAFVDGNYDAVLCTFNVDEIMKAITSKEEKRIQWKMCRSVWKQIKTEKGKRAGLVKGFSPFSSYKIHFYEKKWKILFTFLS